MALVNYYGGEPWFDNPALVLANRRKTKMRKNRRRGRRRSSRRAHARSNFYTAGATVNRPRRRRRARHNASAWPNRRRRSTKTFRRRHYRSNPQLMGFTLPPFDVVAWSAAGLIAPGMVSGWIMPMVPDTWKKNADGTPNQLTIFAIKGASVLLPSMLVRSFVSKRGGNIMLVAGAASLVLQALKTFAPEFSKQIGLGYQPLLGEYMGNVRQFNPRVVNGALSAYGPGLPAVTGNAPNRLDPAQRF